MEQVQWARNLELKKALAEFSSIKPSVGLFFWVSQKGGLLGGVLSNFSKSKFCVDH